MNIVNDMELNWNRLLDITMSFSDTDEYIRLLHGLEQDKIIGEVVLLGLCRAPGSKNRHHNIEGGLVKHLLEMYHLWLGMRNMIYSYGEHPFLTDENVWKCILHHDLNKVWKYKCISNDPWEVDYAGELDRMSFLLGDTNKSLSLLNQYRIPLNLPLHNALITAEGGFSKVRPDTETVLAKMAYLLDDMSANVADRLQSGQFWDSKKGGLGEVP